MKWTRFVANALRLRPARRPGTGNMIEPLRASGRDYPSAGLTPSRLAAILREADHGSLSTAMQLFEEMEEKDAHLFSVANTRRLALTGLEWEVVSAAGGSSAARRLADTAAAYATDILERIETFDETLQHLALALGRNIALAEIVWDDVDGALLPVDILPVDFERIVFDDHNQPRILTDEDPRDGVELPPNKFIVHTPHGASSHPQRGGLLRVSAMIYLAKNLALKDWMIFAEVFGMPVRIARYAPSATADEKRELLRMLESLGSNASGIFSQAVELEFVEANRGSAGPPYERLINLLNREMSKAWLGQTLTTDISGQRGSLAATRVHQLVRQDLLADDIRKEGRTIRRDLLRPLVQFRFGEQAPVPRFRRKLRDTVPVDALAGMLGTAVNELGVRIPEAWAHQALGIPRASATETTLPGRAP